MSQDLITLKNELEKLLKAHVPEVNSYWLTVYFHFGTIELRDRFEEAEQQKETPGAPNLVEITETHEKMVITLHELVESGKIKNRSNREFISDMYARIFDYTPALTTLTIPQQKYLFDLHKQYCQDTHEEG